jgi:hypothetical protein
METIDLQISVDRQDIVTICHLLDGHEGLALARTVQPPGGILQLEVSPHQLEDLLTFLRYLSREFRLKIVGGLPEGQEWPGVDD